MVQLHKRDKPALGEEPRAQSAIDLRDVAQRPQRPASLIDTLPCCLARDTKGDEVANDRPSALPVVQQDRAEPTPNVGVQRAQRELLAGRGDPEELSMCCRSDLVISSNGQQRSTRA